MKKIFLLIFILLTAYIAISAHENTEKKEQSPARTEEQVMAEIRVVFNREIEAFEEFLNRRIFRHNVRDGGDTDFPLDFAKMSSAISRIKKNRAVWEYENATTEERIIRRGREVLYLDGQLCQDLTNQVAEAAVRYNHGIVNSNVMIDAQIKRNEAFIEKLMFEQNSIRSMR